MSSTCLSVPVQHLDYSFIQSCSDVKHVEEILRVLRSGQVGIYSHLIDFCEKHLEKLDPRSQELVKEKPPIRGDNSINEELQLWERSVRMNEDRLQHRPVIREDKKLPPVRQTLSLFPNGTPSFTKKREKSCVPRTYKDWDRLNVDSDESSETQASITQTSLAHTCSNVTHTISDSALSLQERERFALHEKEKGNDAFRSGDYEEALLYYNRSLSLVSTAAAFNNRAQTQIKLKHWREALSDCESVLQLQPDNIKALLRRSKALTQLGRTPESHEDLKRVLESEPHNMMAQELVKKEKAKTGRRIFIEEVEEEVERDTTKKIEVTEEKMIEGVEERLEEVAQQELGSRVSEPQEILAERMHSNSHPREEKRRRIVCITEVDDDHYDE